MCQGAGQETYGATAEGSEVRLDCWSVAFRFPGVALGCAILTRAANDLSRDVFRRALLLSVIHALRQVQQGLLLVVENRRAKRLFNWLDLGMTDVGSSRPSVYYIHCLRARDAKVLVLLSFGSSNFLLGSHNSAIRVAVITIVTSFRSAVPVC